MALAGCMLAGASLLRGKELAAIGHASPVEVMGSVRTKILAELAAARKVKKEEPAPSPWATDGTLTYTDGTPAEGVVVTDGTTCVVTDEQGKYSFERDSTARFVYYTVPAHCQVPTHSATDLTACFYLAAKKGRSTYDFTLTRLPGGVEKDYRMIVIGDPQVTNSANPYYESPDDNPVTKSDIARFTDETMVDIRRTIAQWPDSMPVYGLSMGDDVQYYGGYNAQLERQIRTALGSSRMRLFSVIGNHDQDGSALYKRKWEDSWGPTDYSFDRGNDHYICLNNVQFTRKKSYYSPGELTEKQMHWLKRDLALTPKHKKVILCYHIPFTFGCSPSSKAQPLPLAAEGGHYSSARLSELLQLLSQFSEGGYELFCGHTHFAINHEIDFAGQHIMEHCHAAACGNIWQSNINLCGTPNGYYVYAMAEGNISDCYYKGTFWEKSRQMTLFSASTNFNDESYAADWNLPADRNVIIANVFNVDSRWTVTAIADGIEYPMHRIVSRGQDAFATSYHHKYCKAMTYQFVGKQNGYLLMNHLFYFEPQRADAEITVRARDPYGHVYEAKSSEAISEPFFNFAHYYSTR